MAGRLLTRGLFYGSAITLLSACALHSPAPHDAPLTQLVAQGNEPFWSVTVDGNTLTWKTPEMPEGIQLSTRRLADSQGVGFTGQDGDGRRFMLDISRRPCTDSMSGAAFEFTAVWILDGARTLGCARRGH